MRYALALLLCCLSLPLGAQEPPACDARREGLEVCIAAKLCRCRHEPGGSLTGRPPGMRWDCGVLRPSCGVAPAGPPQQAAPPIFLSLPPAGMRPGR